MTTSTDEDPKKKSHPQLVKLNRAFKLAEQWANNMSKSTVNEKPILVKLEGRPSRLGIGATVPRESNNFARSSDPVERKLLAKLMQTGKREINKRAEGSGPSAKEDEDSDEDESESKTRAFAKKRPPSFSSLNVKKGRR